MHQVSGLDDQILDAVGNGTVHGLLHVVDLLAVTSLDMVDDDLSGECTADRPIGVSGLQSILDALDVFHAAVVERGAEADHQQLVVADVVLIAGVILGSIAGVAAKVIGISLFPLDQLFLGVGQSVPGVLGSLALFIGVLVALLHIDGVDQVCHVLCGHFVSLLAAHLAGGCAGCCLAGSGGAAGSAAAAACQGADAERQSGGDCHGLFPIEFTHGSCLFLSCFCLCADFLTERVQAVRPDTKRALLPRGVHNKKTPVISGLFGTTNSS